MKKDETINLVFMTNVNLSSGGGMERALLNFIDYIPEDIARNYKIKIVQTSIFDRQRLNKDEINEILNKHNVELITLDGFNKKLISFNVGTVSFILNTLTESFRNRSFKNYIRTITSEADVIYLFHNSFQSFLKKGPIIIGSFYERNPNPNAYSGFTKVITQLGIKLMKTKLMWRKISIYHYEAHNLKGYVPKKSFYLPLGIDLDKYILKDAEIENKRIDDVIRILFVGRLVESKGLRILIEAFQKIYQNGKFELHIVGTGEMESYITSLKADGIVYHGQVSDNYLSQIYKKCNVFVFPSTGDIFGLVILEAIASGMYVIANETLRGVFNEFERVGVLEYSNPTRDDIANRIMNFNRDRINIRIYKDVLNIIKRYDWTEIVSELYGTFQRLMKSTALDKSPTNRYGVDTVQRRANNKDKWR